MPVKIHKVDPSVPSGDRHVSWTTTDFVVLDVLDIESSLGRPGTRLIVTAGSTASVTLRLNSYHRSYPLNEDAKTIGMPMLDLETERTWSDTGAYTFTVENGETFEEDLTVKNLEVTALTAGNGITITIL